MREGGHTSQLIATNLIGRNNLGDQHSVELWCSYYNHHSDDRMNYTATIWLGHFVSVSIFIIALHILRCCAHAAASQKKNILCFVFASLSSG